MSTTAEINQRNLPETETPEITADKPASLELLDMDPLARERIERGRAIAGLETQTGLLEQNLSELTKELSEEVDGLQQERLQENPLYKAYQRCIPVLKSLVDISKDFKSKTGEFAAGVGKVSWEIGKAGVVSGAAGAAAWEAISLMEKIYTTGDFTKDDNREKILIASIISVCALLRWVVHRLEQKEASKKLKN